MQRDSLANTFAVSLVLCIVCSMIVSVSAVGLRSYQEENKVLDRQRNIIAAAGLFDKGSPTTDDVKEIFSRIEKKVIDLETGEYVETGLIDPETFDQRKSAKTDNVPVTGQFQTGISTREKYSLVYLVKSASDPNVVEQYVFPVYGKGLWSTLYGYLAVENDLNTVKGLTFYEHAETPGLGGEVDATWWKQQWPGKKIYDESKVGSNDGLRVGVAKGSPVGDRAKYEVDGLSGATITSRGVGNLLKYWFSDAAFGKYVKKQLAKKGTSNG